VDVVLAQVTGLDPANAIGLVVDCGFTANRSADIGHLELLAGFAVAAVDDDVCRVRIDPEEASDLGLDAGLLLALAYGAFGGRFADVLLTAGQRPLPRWR
jgi:hypothetical protein